MVTGLHVENNIFVVSGKFGQRVMCLARHRLALFTETQTTERSS